MGERADVVVVGGGLAGLSAALELRANGRDVLVLEQASRLGGKAGSVFSGAGVLPTGPTSFNGRHPAFWKLLGLLGIEDEAQRLSPRSLARYVVRAGRLEAIRPSPLSVLTTGALTLSDKFALAKDLFSRRRHEAVEDETLDAFLERRFGRPLVDHFFAAVLTGIFAGDLKQLSAASCLPALVNAEKEYGSVLRGAIKALRRPVEGSRTGLFTFARGMGRMAERATELLPHRVGVSVTKLSLTAGHVSISFRDAAGAHVIDAQHVVVAAEAPGAAALLAPFAPAASSVLSTLRYSPVTLVSWAEKSPGASKLPSGFGYLCAPIEECFALGTLFVGDLLDESPRRFSTFVGGGVFPDRARAPNEDLAAGIAGDIKRLCGGEVGELVDVQRWKLGVFQPPPGHAKVLAQLAAAQTEPRVTLAGSYFGGAAMKDAIESGFKAASSVLASVPAVRATAVEARA